MPTAFDTPIVPFTGPFADLPAQFLEASTRALTASAELYTQVLRTQADATRQMIEAYAGFAPQAVRAGAETTQRTDEATAEVARGTRRAAQRATRRTGAATHRAAEQTRAAKPAAVVAAPAEAPIPRTDDVSTDGALNVEES